MRSARRALGRERNRRFLASLLVLIFLAFAICSSKPLHHHDSEEEHAQGNCLFCHFATGEVLDLTHESPEIVFQDTFHTLSFTQISKVFFTYDPAIFPERGPPSHS